MAPVLETEERKLAGGNGGGPRGPDFNDPGGRGWGDDGGQDGYGRPYVPGAGLLAMRFMLVSIAVLFITVGFAYFERSRSAVNWQHIQIPHLLWLSTALILASGWALETARGALERNSNGSYVRWLEITVAIGLAFLGSQLFAMRELMAQGLYLRHNPHSSLFYVVTGAHGLHLLGGIAALCYLLLRASLRPELIRTDHRRQRSRTAVSALYWHFLTILWLGLFLFLLVWP
jgi:cytochrome c oxidase subunit 3